MSSVEPATRSTRAFRALVGGMMVDLLENATVPDTQRYIGEMMELKMLLPILALL